MSNRMRESIQSDMEYLHNIRMSDVEEAQQRIVAVIRRLEEEGEIVISRMERMRSLYRVIKSGQTVLGEGRVPAYQMNGPETAQAEEISGEPGNAAREAADGAVPRYALISEEKRKILNMPETRQNSLPPGFLEDAYAQRDKIVNTALTEAERLKQQAEEHGYEDGIKPGRSGHIRWAKMIGRSVEQAGRQLERALGGDKGKNYRDGPCDRGKICREK